MTFSLLAHGIGLFVAALITHVLLWNMFRIRREVLWLAVVFVVIPLMVLATLRAVGYLETAVSATAVGLLHMALAVVYVQTYPALREDIPSLRILMLVHGHPGGRTRDDLVAQLTGHGLFETKLRDLENDAFVRARDGRMTLTAAGAALATVFDLYRRWLGRSAGKG
jgi:hypothetical protein